MRMPMWEKAWKHSVPLIPTKEAKVKSRSLLIVLPIADVSFQLIRTAQSLSSDNWIEKILLAIRCVHYF